MNKAYLLTGSNIGNRINYLDQAAALIEAGGHCIVNRSPVYETGAWGKTDQASFLNQALLVETVLPADILLKQLLLIEQEMGRQRTEQYGPRTIDIDILLYNEEIINTPDITVPHPQLPGRRFALQPLSDIASELQHPLLKQSIHQLLEDCKDTLPIERWTANIKPSKTRSE